MDKSQGIRISHSVFSVDGPLPKTFTFSAPLGSEVVIDVAGSGFTESPSIIGVRVSLGGEDLGTLKSFSNEAKSHKAFVSKSFQTKSKSGGGQFLQLEALNGTITDFNDNFTVKVTVLH